MTLVAFEGKRGDGRACLFVDVQDSATPIQDVVDYANSMNSGSRIVYVVGIDHRDFLVATGIGSYDDVPYNKIARVSVGNGAVRTMQPDGPFAGLVLEWGKGLAGGGRFKWALTSPENQGETKPAPDPAGHDSYDVDEELLSWDGNNYSPDGLCYPCAAEDYFLDQEEIARLKAVSPKETKVMTARRRSGVPPLIIRSLREGNHPRYMEWVNDTQNTKKWVGKEGESPFYMADSISPHPDNPAAGFIDRTRLMLGGFAGRYCEAGLANKTSGPERRMVTALEQSGVPIVRDRCRIAVRMFRCHKDTRWFPKGTAIHGYFIDVDTPLLYARADGRRLAVEYDGVRYHGGEEDMKVDEERDRALSRVGVDVIRVREPGLPPLSSAWHNVMLRSTGGASEAEIAEVVDSIKEWYMDGGCTMEHTIDKGAPERIVPVSEVYHYMPLDARPKGSGAATAPGVASSGASSPVSGGSYSVDATGDGVTVPKKGRVLLSPGGGDALRAVFNSLVASASEGGAQEKTEEPEPMPRVVRRGGRRGTVL